MLGSGNAANSKRQTTMANPIPPQTGGFRLAYELDRRPVTVQFSQPEVLIGRSTECDLVLPLPGLSRKHAVIQKSGEGWTIADLGSLNGTFVNQRRVSEQPLQTGDRISPGPEAQFPVTLHFSIADEPPEQEDLVVFDDRVEHASVGLTIDVEEFARLMGEGAQTVSPGGPGVGVDPARGSIVRLFKQVGEALLVSEDLDEMLEQVVGLALDHLPARRGLICLCDETAEQITLQATRTKGLPRGESITISRSIARAAIESRQALLVTDAPRDARFDQAESIRKLEIRAAMCAPLYHAGQVRGIIYVDTDRPEDQFTAHDLELLAALGGLTAVGIEQARLREDVQRERAIRAKLSRYHSPAVVEQIAARATGRLGEMAPEECEVSVLFGDLCGFTPMAARMQPPQVAEILDGVFEQLTHAVFLYGGTLDKYMGDAVMAIFGAPLVQPNHAERAIRAALRMQELLERFNAARPAADPLRIRVGINSGTAVAGDIGSPVQKGYTVIGDVVNVASRLESSVAAAGQVVIGPATYEQVRTAFECRPLPEVRLRGRQEMIRPYVVVGPLGDATLDLQETV
jgi:adenylate cyclase